jgi:hypothetical protein
VGRVRRALRFNAKTQQAITVTVRHDRFASKTLDH